MNTNLHACTFQGFVPVHTDPILCRSRMGSFFVEQGLPTFTNLPCRLPSLTNREVFIAIFRCGFGGYRPTTLADIGATLGVTSERVRQLQRHIESKLSQSEYPHEHRFADALRQRSRQSWRLPKRTRVILKDKYPHYRRLSNVLRQMKDRCCNPKNRAYKWYGNRGIRVCDKWKTSVSAFVRWALRHGYQVGLTIDRMDNDKDYSPSNCQWITIGDNLRKKIKKMHVAFGDSKPITEWLQDDRCVVGPNTFKSRLTRGWSIEKALTVPAEEGYKERERKRILAESREAPDAKWTLEA